MPAQMIIRIDPELKNKLYRLAKTEGKSSSQMVRELIQDYIKERDINAYIDDLWKRIGAKLTSRGIKPKDIENAVKKARKNKK
jgi:predicted DNA-binding protein